MIAASIIGGWVALALLNAYLIGRFETYEKQPAIGSDERGFVVVLAALLSPLATIAIVGYAISTLGVTHRARAIERARQREIAELERLRELREAQAEIDFALTGGAR